MSKLEQRKIIKKKIKDLERLETIHDEAVQIRSNMSSWCRNEVQELEEELDRLKSPGKNMVRLKDIWKENRLDQAMFELWDQWSNTWKYNFSFDDCRKFNEQAKSVRLYLTRAIRDIENQVRLDD